MVDGGGPEHDERVLARHAIDDADERLRQLRALLVGRERVTLHVAGDPDTSVVSRLLAIDADRDVVELEFDTEPLRHAAFRDATGATAVALPGRIKLQFELERVQIVRHDAGSLLRAPIPHRLARLQRRDAFRVAPPPSTVPRLWLRDADRERAVQVLDVSATGIAFAWPADLAPPAVGDRLGDCRVELPATAPIRCDLLVRSVESQDPGSNASVRIGSAFDALAPSSARAVQVFVNLAQARGRKARPRLR